MKSKINYKQPHIELLTLGDWVHFSTSALDQAQVYLGHGTDNHWDEAVHLVLGTLHIPLDSDPEVLATKLLSEEQTLLEQALQARIEQRLPTPYITKTAYCLGVPFYVDQRVLIPRSPFAEWIEKRFEPWIDSTAVTSILEIGTGSGCLALSCAFKFPHAEIVATDISQKALEVAKINRERYALQKQVQLIESDCYQQLEGRRFDIIFSNPPYVGTDEMATLPPEYLHEPRGALEAAEEGLEIVKRIIFLANNHLKPGGILMVEVGNSEDLLAETFPQIPFVWVEQEFGGHGIFVLTKAQLEELNER